jgi:hypothetical protein
MNHEQTKHAVASNQQSNSGTTGSLLNTVQSRLGSVFAGLTGSQTQNVPTTAPQLQLVTRPTTQQTGFAGHTGFQNAVAPNLQLDMIDRSGLTGHHSAHVPRDITVLHGTNVQSGITVDDVRRMLNEIVQQRDGNAGLTDRGARGHLVAHDADGLGTGSDELDMARLANFGEMGVLGEEAVTGMDRVDVGDLGGFP